jgi:hypothetical protein
MTDDIDIGESEKLYLPWDHNDSGLITGTPDDPESGDYPHIADLAQEFGMEGPGDKFRADFLVLACNTHHNQHAALQAIYRWWTETPGFQNGEDDMPAEIFDAIRDAIAKVKKEGAT